MSLPHAILTALLERSSSGSELARRFDRSIGLFWHATHQQIYRELGRLETAGWVLSTPLPEARGRKKIYKVLAAGKRELRRWTNASEDPAPVREQLMLRLRAEAVIGPTTLSADIARRLEIHRKRVELFRQIEAHDFSADRDSHESRIRHLILEAGIMIQESWAEWSEHALAVLEASSKKT
jgi:DNA-binding PadR family transcriptional regulator